MSPSKSPAGRERGGEYAECEGEERARVARSTRLYSAAERAISTGPAGEKKKR